ncbi:MAG: IS1182 family transposase [Kiloniellales bacterium]|nr:IS1182 family transposase [Kiloniellales bacterium]
MVPAEHLVRRIDQVLDLSWLRGALAPFYSHTGRPSIDPELMMRMLVIGYVFAIRSERQLCAEVRVNLAYRWFCRPGLEDKIPDHSAFSRARHERFRVSDALRRMFERVVETGIAAGLVGTAYGSGATLKSLIERGIEPHIPVWDKSNQTQGRFTKADFTYDERRDLYICPGGKHLTCSGRVDQGRILPYRASVRDCASCALKPHCTRASARKISRDIDEPIRDRVRALAKTEAFETSRRHRKKVEMAFAHMKRIFKLDRLRLRGLSGARDEVLLTATAQNLRKLARYAYQPPPIQNLT